MARYKTPLHESLAWELYDVLLKWFKTTKSIPSLHGFWKYVLPTYGYSDVTFFRCRYQFADLVYHGLITFEPRTNAIAITSLEVIQSTDPDLAKRVQALNSSDSQVLAVV